MDKESGIDSSLDRTEINHGFSTGPPVNAIVHEFSSSAENVEVRPKDLASAFKGAEPGETRWNNFVRSQSKENSPTASPSRLRDNNSPVENVDPKGAQAVPRFALTKDIVDAIDLLSQEGGEEETMPETLLHGHFKVLHDKGELNTVEEVKAAYMRVLGNDDCIYVYIRAQTHSALPPRILWVHRNS
jgi:hypothetical protein